MDSVEAFGHISICMGDNYSVIELARVSFTGRSFFFKVLLLMRYVCLLSLAEINQESYNIELTRAQSANRLHCSTTIKRLTYDQLRRRVQRLVMAHRLLMKFLGNEDTLFNQSSLRYLIRVQSSSELGSNYSFLDLFSYKFFSVL